MEKIVFAKLGKIHWWIQTESEYRWTYETTTWFDVHVKDLVKGKKDCEEEKVIEKQ